MKSHRHITLLASVLATVAIPSALRAKAPDASSAAPASELGQPVRILAGSVPVDASTGHAAPYVIDIDGDGIRDLLVGEFGNTRFDDSRLPPHVVSRSGPNYFAAGKLRIYKNHGTNTGPSFRDFTYLKAKKEDASVPITCCISFCPHFVDYDGDGDLDILSGSYTGEIYLFVRDENGTFQQGVPILNERGSPLQTGEAVTVEAHDFDGDGDLDLLIAERSLYISYHENIGTRTAPSYADRSSRIETRGGHSIYGSNAHYADWDHDGIRDLILGSEDGDVTWYKNVGADNKPVFDEMQMLINIKQYGFEKIQRENAPTRPGNRTKVHVTDWNGDGRVDLLVGDLRQLYYTENPLTETEKKELEVLEREYKQAKGKHQALSDEVDSYHNNNKQIPKELLNRFLYARDERDALYERMFKYHRERSKAHGFVWLYLRNETASTTAAPNQPASDRAEHVSLKAEAKPGKEDNTYQVTLRLDIAPGWHTYAEDPDGAYSVPTPKLELPEGMEQVGTFITKETRKDATNGSEAVWYVDQVTFTATVRRKPDAKGPIKAIVSFQRCDDNICMPESQLSSSIDL
jgi:hypothetical protein